MSKLEPIKILIVEDNPQDVEMIKGEMSKGRIKNELFHVDDGAKAVDFLKHEGPYSKGTQFPRPDLILLDLKIPLLSGLDVLKVIKQDHALKNIPVIVLTSSDEDIDIKKAYDLGANSYLAKPVGLEAFVSVMQKLKEYWFVVARIPKEDVR
jgi:CheY-like chemotaxis protein